MSGLTLIFATAGSIRRPAVSYLLTVLLCASPTRLPRASKRRTSAAAGPERHNPRPTAARVVEALLGRHRRTARTIGRPAPRMHGDADVINPQIEQQPDKANDCLDITGPCGIALRDQSPLITSVRGNGPDMPPPVEGWPGVANGIHAHDLDRVPPFADQCFETLFRHTVRQLSYWHLCVLTLPASLGAGGLCPLAILFSRFHQYYIMAMKRAYFPRNSGGTL